MEAAQDSFISSTTWTERIGPVAALATIRKHRELDVGNHLMSIGKQVQEGWTMQAEKNGLSLHITGIPPLSHFSFEHDDPLVMKALFIQFMLEKGFLASNLFYAMFSHQPEHVGLYLQAVEEVFAQISAASKSGTLQEKLQGLPASAGFKRLA